VASFGEANDKPRRERLAEQSQDIKAGQLAKAMFGIDVGAGFGAAGLAILESLMQPAFVQAVSESVQAQAGTGGTRSSDQPEAAPELTMLSGSGSQPEPTDLDRLEFESQPAAQAIVPTDTNQIDYIDEVTGQTQVIVVSPEFEARRDEFAREYFDLPADADLTQSRSPNFGVKVIDFANRMIGDPELTFPAFPPAVGGTEQSEQSILRQELKQQAEQKTQQQVDSILGSTDSSRASQEIDDSQFTINTAQPATTAAPQPQFQDQAQQQQVDLLNSDDSSRASQEQLDGEMFTIDTAQPATAAAPQPPLQDQTQQRQVDSILDSTDSSGASQEIAAPPASNNKPIPNFNLGSVDTDMADRSPASLKDLEPQSHSTIQSVDIPQQPTESKKTQGGKPYKLDDKEKETRRQKQLQNHHAFLAREAERKIQQKFGVTPQWAGGNPYGGQGFGSGLQSATNTANQTMNSSQDFMEQSTQTHEATAMLATNMAARLRIARQKILESNY
jgi:hypothetical protein